MADDYLFSKKIKEYIRHKKYYIFGTGAVGIRFYKNLMRNGYEKCVTGFVISEHINEDVTVYGKKVYCIDKINRSENIVIAVHSSIVREIEEKLNFMGFKDYIWIYPYLFDLDYSSPISVNEILSVDEVIRKQRYVYSHIIYYLAIENYFSLNEIGKMLYIKLMNSFSELKTAIKRANCFYESIGNFKRDGYKQDYNIKINQSHDIILDGAHRLMLAKFFGKKYIKADIYNCDIRKYVEASGKVALTEKRMREVFSEEEIAIIKEAKDRLKV